MAFIIRNKTASIIDIEDLGLRLRASADRDITIEGLGAIFDSVDLAGFVSAGDIVVMDADGTTELSTVASITATEGALAAAGGGEIDSETAIIVGPETTTIVSQDTWTDVPNATIDITTTESGRIWAIVSLTAIIGDAATTTNFEGRIVINGVDGNPIGVRVALEPIDRNVQQRSAVLAAGTYTVKFQVKNLENTLDVNIQNLTILAMSLAAPTGADGADGTDGAQGVAGSGTTLNIQQDGTPVANSPHQTINFIGDVTAVDAGSPAGVVDVTVSGGGGGVAVDRQQASSATNFATTSQSLVDIASMTLTTNDLGEAGDYVITFSCEYASAEDKEDNTFSLNVNGSEVATRRTVGYKKNKWGGFSMSYLAEGVASGTVIKMQVKVKVEELDIESRELVIDGIGESNVI